MGERVNGVFRIVVECDADGCEDLEVEFGATTKEAQQRIRELKWSIGRAGVSCPKHAGKSATKKKTSHKRAKP